MKSITLLSHNVFWFQGVPFDTDQPDTPDDEILDALIGVYAQIGVDVFCFQELQTKATFDHVCGKLGRAGHYTPGSILHQYGVATLWYSGSCTAQAPQSGDPPQRAWQTIASSGFSICNVHLPSGRQLGHAAAGIRRVEELCQAIASLPDVVLGDFNEQPGGPVGDFLNTQGYLDTAALSGRADQPTTISGKRGDQIWVHQRIRDRVCDYQVSLRADLETSFNGKTSLSDHLPLWIQLAV